MRRAEQAIQKAVFDHLKMRAAPGVFAFHPANGGWRSPIEAKILVGQGVRAGVPDVIAVRAGQFYALELKAEHGKLSNSQKSAHEALAAAGAIVGTAYGLDQALNWLEVHGLLKGRAA